VSIVRAGVLIAAAGALTLFVSVAAHADGDAKHGRSVFFQCQACHSLVPGQKGIGPNLHGLFGRKAGTEPHFAYSPFMKRSGITWNEESLRSYLPDPQAKVPGTKMTFVGVQDPQKLEDLIAYLKEATR
jgi:cytochrome c